MRLEELNEVAGIVSAAAIVATAFYAALQIRHNTRAVRASAFQQVIDSFAAISFDIARDKALVELSIRAGRDFASLSEAERTQYSLMLLNFMRRAENVLFQSSAHLLTGEHWSGIRNSIKAILAPPGARACWAELQDRLNPDFRAFVATLVAELAEAPASPQASSSRA